MRRCLSILAALALGFACGGGGDEDDDGVLTAAARLPGQHPELVFTLVSPDRLTFDYRSPPPADLFERGQILVGEEYGGYLRRVDSVVIDGNRLVAQTRQANLTEAIANLRFEQRLAAEPEGARVPLLDLTGRVLLDTLVDGVPAKLTLVRAALQLQPSIAVSFTIAGRRLEQLAVSFSASATLDADLRLELGAASAAPVAHEVDVSGPSFLLYSRPFSFPVATPLGPLPIAGTFELDAIAGFRATPAAPGAVTLGVTGQSAFNLNAVWEDGQWSITTPSPSTFLATAHVPVRESLRSAELATYLRPVLHARFFGLAGPSASLVPALKAALPDADPAPLSLESCVAVDVAVPSDLFGPERLDDLALPLSEICQPLALP